MVDNLDSPRFQAYGSLPGEDSYGQNYRESVIRPETGDACWVCDTHRVLLLPGEGMNALCVSGGEQQEGIFYLDKPVLLKKRIQFRIFSMSATSSVRMYIPWDAELRRGEGQGNMPELTLEPSVRIERIYTIFCQEKAGGFFFPGEKHEPYELTLVHSGKLHCLAGGQEYTLCAGEALLCLPQQWHMQYADPDETVSFFTVSFDLFCHEASMMAKQVYQANEKMQTCIQRLMEGRTSPGTADADQMILYLTELIAEMRRMALEKGDTGSMKAYSPLAEKAVRYINDHLHEHLTVADVAAAVNVSAPYLAVLFRRYLHQSPADTIRRLKMEEGRKLLSQRGMNVQETARTLGFATPQHFSRCFKEYFGFTPKTCAGKNQ